MKLAFKVKSKQTNRKKHKDRDRGTWEAGETEQSETQSATKTNRNYQETWQS